jgi:rhamnogalacturonyl hydrolase YesR
MKRTLITLSLMLVAAQVLLAQSAAEQQPRILRALQVGSKYAATQVLDAQGRAKGDYDLISSQWYEYEAAWHTGQTINGLLAAYEITKDKALLNAARKAGDWWISLEYKDHPKLKGMLRAIHGADVGNIIVTATITDGSAGLFRLSRITGERKYADSATRAGNWIMQNLYLENEALIYDGVNPDTGEVMKDKSPFKARQGDGKAALFDVARPNNEGFLFKDMYLHTKDERYKKVFLNLCDGLVKRQHDNGFWMDFDPNDPKTGKIHPRFNLWNAESLLEGYELTKNPAYLEAALKTARATHKLQRKSGVMYYTNYVDGRTREDSIVGSGVSFAGILWLKLHRLGYQEFKDSIERSLNWTLQNQFSPAHPDPNLAGAFFETRVTHQSDQSVRFIVRDIASAFALRFLADYYQTLVLKK